MFTTHSSLRNWVTSSAWAPQGSQKASVWGNVAMHFKKNQLLRSGEKIYYWALQGKHAPAGWRLRGTGSRWPRWPPPTRPARGRPLHEAGPGRLRSRGSRALALPPGWDRIWQPGLCTSILNISFLSEANRAFPYLNANFLVKNPPLLTRDWKSFKSQM